MTIVWRHMIKQFLRYFLLCMLGFIVVLLVSRMLEIARFAALASDFKSVILFILYQIPYIFPYCLPISALIAAAILAQTLSHSKELTSLRTGGLSLSQITFPLIILGFFLAGTNFYIVSEVGPICRRLSSELLFRSVTDNPLTLLKKSKFLNIKDCYVDLKIIDQDKHAKDLIFAFKTSNDTRLNLIVAQDLDLKKNDITARNSSMIHSSPAVSSDHFDLLMVENEPSLTSDADMVSWLIKNRDKATSTDFMSLKACLIQLGHSTSKNTLVLEIMKRVFFGVISFVFLYIGLSFGVEIGRIAKRKRFFIMALMSISIFIGYFIAKNFDTGFFLPLIFYFLPVITTLILCKRRQILIEHGVE